MGARDEARVATYLEHAFYDGGSFTCCASPACTPDGGAASPMTEVEHAEHVVALLGALADDPAQATTLARIEALCDDPWTARNWGELARYQEGVTRRGAVKYGDFVSVADLRAALAGGQTEEPAS